MKRVLYRCLTIALTVLMGGFLAATMVRFAPGSGIDERELDSRLSSDSVRAIRQANSQQPLMVFYWSFWRRALRGDLGVSRTFEQPIARLLALRWRVSAQSIGYALSMSWLTVLIVVGSTVLIQSVTADIVSSAVAGALLAMPTAMVALMVGSRKGSVTSTLMLVVAPTVFRYTRNIVGKNQNQTYIVAARAQGVARTRLLVRHVLPNAAPQLISLAGISVSVAIGALIPIEFLCDSPGVGQLALQAALGRDLPLLVVLTIGVTIVTLSANLIADIAGAAMSPIRS